MHLTSFRLRSSAATWAVASLLAYAGAAQALSITSVSPQGEVARVRQMVVKFDTAAVRFGDPKAPAPFSVSCDNSDASKGTGRWTGDREWVFDFAKDLPPGVRCTATPKAGFKSPDGAALSGSKNYQFSTGGRSCATSAPAPIRKSMKSSSLSLR